MAAVVLNGAELGYEVTVVSDATASYSEEQMHAALEINIPNYATAILSAEEIVDAISKSTA
ncbi:MAG TPA: isochorismatase family protein [Mycobacterium sp.]|nr:isochorismatase family protein [Mycobacterium sp.]